MLEQLRMGMTQRVGPSVVQSMGVELVATRELEHMLLALTAVVLGQNCGSREQEARTVVEWHMPATWVQHWKIAAGARWRVVAWWNRRRPPRMTTVSRPVRTCVVWDEKIGYPHSTLAFDPRLGTPVVYTSAIGSPFVEPGAARYGR